MRLSRTRLTYTIYQDELTHKLLFGTGICEESFPGRGALCLLAFCLLSCPIGHIFFRCQVLVKQFSKQIVTADKFHIADEESVAVLYGQHLTCSLSAALLAAI